MEIVLAPNENPFGRLVSHFSSQVCLNGELVSQPTFCEERLTLNDRKLG